MGAGSSRQINIHIAIPAFITCALDYCGTVRSGRMRRRDYLYTTILEFLKELWCQLNLWRGEGLEQAVIPGGTAELTHKGLVGEEGKREAKAGRERLGQWNGPRPQDRVKPRPKPSGWLQHQVTPRKALENPMYSSQAVLAEMALTNRSG